MGRLRYGYSHPSYGYPHEGKLQTTDSHPSYGYPREGKLTQDSAAQVEALQHQSGPRSSPTPKRPKVKAQAEAPQVCDRDHERARNVREVDVDLVRHQLGRRLRPHVGSPPEAARRPRTQRPGKRRTIAQA